jgi:hypothetical protein
MCCILVARDYFRNYLNARGGVAFLLSVLLMRKFFVCEL